MKDNFCIPSYFYFVLQWTFDTNFFVQKDLDKVGVVTSKCYQIAKLQNSFISCHHSHSHTFSVENSLDAHAPIKCRIHWNWDHHMSRLNAVAKRHTRHTTDSTTNFLNSCRFVLNIRNVVPIFWWKSWRCAHQKRPRNVFSLFRLAKHCRHVSAKQPANQWHQPHLQTVSKIDILNFKISNGNSRSAFRRVRSKRSSNNIALVAKRFQSKFD